MASKRKFPGCSFLDDTLGMTFPYFQSLGFSSNHHSILKTIKSNFVMTSIISLTTWVIFHHIQQTLRFFRCFLTWSSSTEGKYCLLQAFSLISGAYDSSNLILTVRTEKLSLSSSALWEVHHIPHPIHQQTHIIPSLLSTADPSIAIFLAVIYVSCQAKPQMGSGFLYLHPCMFEGGLHTIPRPPIPASNSCIHWCFLDEWKPATLLEAFNKELRSEKTTGNHYTRVQHENMDSQFSYTR